MSEAQTRFDPLHAGAFLAPRTLPIKNRTVRPGSLYAPTHGVKAYWTFVMNEHVAELVEGEALYGFVVAAAPEPPQAHFIERVERLRRELGRLQDGWCGPGSLAPSNQVLSDLDKLLITIPTTSDAPEVEVDEGTGFVTLRWVRPDYPAGFSFVLRGNGQALAVRTLFDPPHATSRPFDLQREQSALARYLESDALVSGALAPA